jgi:hypothetical protein
MENAKTFLSGTTVICHLTTYDRNEALMNADSPPTITIRKQPLPIVIVDQGEMVNVGLGKYEYSWDTTGVSAGVYEIEFNMTVNGDKRRIIEERTITDGGEI